MKIQRATTKHMEWQITRPKKFNFIFGLGWDISSRILFSFTQKWNRKKNKNDGKVNKNERKYGKNTWKTQIGQKNYGVWKHWRGTFGDRRRGNLKIFQANWGNLKSFEDFSRKITESWWSMHKFRRFKCKSSCGQLMPLKMVETNAEYIY